MMASTVPFRGLPEHTIVRLIAYLIPAGYGAFCIYDALHGGLADLLDDGYGFALTALAKAVAGIALTIFLVHRGDIVGRFGALERLRTHPEDVVWAYERTVTTVSAGGSSRDHAFVFGFRDGKRYAWSLDGPVVERPDVRSFLAQLPRATFGHSPELEARFVASPATFPHGGTP
jgi:hypothetical protein